MQTKQGDERQDTEPSPVFPVGTTPIELEYNFLLPETEITSIEIVKLGMSEYWYKSPEEQYSICKIEDTTDFLKQFSEVTCFLNVAPPTKVEDESIVFKISYGDDCYELIGVNGQSKIHYDHSPFDGYRYFEGQQFSRLIDLYIEQRYNDKEHSRQFSVCYKK